MLSTEDTSFVKYYCKILYIQGYDKIKSTKWCINRWGNTFLLSSTETERSSLPQLCKQQQNTTKQTKNPPCKFWVFSHSECRLTMAVKPHSEQDKEIFQMKGRARHKQKGLQFTNSYSRKSSTMLQCTEFLTATHKPWQRAPSPKAAIKPRSIDPSFRVYGQFQPPLF